MKRSTLLLMGSLITNAALVAALAFHSANRDADPTVAPSPSTPETVATGDPRAAEVGAWTALLGEGSDGEAGIGHDLPGFVSRLRAAGLPPNVVRALMEQAVREQFAARREAIVATAKVSDDYWSVRFSPYGSSFDAQARTALRELGREEQQLLRQLLGDDHQAGHEHLVAGRQRRFGPLSSEKIDLLQDITSDYSDLRTEITGSGIIGNLLPEEREQLAYLDRAMREDIAAVLTPEELEQYELRNSRTTSMLRFSLAEIDLSEDEFRTLYRLQKGFDDAFSPNTMAGGAYNRTPEFAKQRSEAEKALLADIKSLLGEPRGTEYERSRDYSYQAIQRIATRLELPKTAAIEAYTMQKEIQQRASAVRSDRSLSREQINTRLAELQQDATTRLGASLGAQGLEAYKTNGGQWIDRLAPRAPPPETSRSAPTPAAAHD